MTDSVLPPSSNTLSRKRKDISNLDDDGLRHTTTKRFRGTEELSKISNQFATKVELQVNTFHSDYRSNIQEKRKILETHSAVSCKMLSCLTNTHQENKILKKGIQIQDQKHRDTITQSSQLQCFMNELLQRIQLLEDYHNSLQNELVRIRNEGKHYDSSPFAPPPPPDVF